jgi:hypothetical protein
MIYGVRAIAKSPLPPRWCDSWVRQDGGILIFDDLQEAEAEAARLNSQSRPAGGIFYEARANPPHLHRLSASAEGEHGYICDACGERNPRMENAIKVRGRLCRKCVKEASGRYCDGLQVGAVEWNLVWHITSAGNVLCGAGGLRFEGDSFLQTLAVEDPEAIMSATDGGMRWPR